MCKPAFSKWSYNGGYMTFSEWLGERINESGLNYSEVARRGGTSHARISQVIGGATPGVGFCIAIARGLQIPREDVFRVAGMLPSLPPEVEEEREVIDLFRRLNAPVRRSMLETMRNLLGLRMPRAAMAEERTDYNPEPRTLSEYQAARLTRNMAQMHPDDAELVLELMERLRGDRRGAMRPDETPVSSK